MAKRKAAPKKKASVERTARRVAKEEMAKHIKAKRPAGHGVTRGKAKAKNKSRKTR